MCWWGEGSVNLFYVNVERKHDCTCVNENLRVNALGMVEPDIMGHAGVILIEKFVKYGYGEVIQPPILVHTIGKSSCVNMVHIKATIGCCIVYYQITNESCRSFLSFSVSTKGLHACVLFIYRLMY